jgi:hypothetical protein
LFIEKFSQMEWRPVRPELLLPVSPRRLLDLKLIFSLLILLNGLAIQYGCRGTPSPGDRQIHRQISVYMHMSPKAGYPWPPGLLLTNPSAHKDLARTATWETGLFFSPI